MEWGCQGIAHLAEDTFDASAEDGQIDAEMDTVEPSGESQPENTEGQFNHRKRRSMLRLKMTISISRWLRLSYPVRTSRRTLVLRLRRWMTWDVSR
ncbi:hypothetical protein AnigIFM56816_000639 [Aspergillus niger]|nr:hypothetical protein AnigIFM56816_000639 [Aspergillus niger]